MEICRNTINRCFTTCQIDEDFYLVQVNPIDEAGNIYIDDLSVITVQKRKMTESTKNITCGK